MSFNEEGLTPGVDGQGTCDTRFEPVRDMLAGQLNSGHDTGASIAVDKMGPGVIGSDRSEAYVRVIQDCLT